VRLSGVGVPSDDKGGVILASLRGFSRALGLWHEIEIAGCWVPVTASVRSQFFEWEGIGGGHSPLSHPSPALPAPSAALPCFTPPLLTSLYLLPPTTRGVDRCVDVS
jgi:hypothetical protein